MDKETAHSLIKKISEVCILTTKHCRQRMTERNVTMDDIRYVIQWGEVVSVEESPEYGNWKCTIKGMDMDGNELTFVAAVTEDEVVCIIVF